MNNLMQPLKLQLAASYKIYILNFIVLIASSLLVYFLGDASLENFAFIIAFEFIFTFVMGVINYSVIGKTYYSLKHDRRLFTLSSFLINVLNALFMLILYFICVVLSKNNIDIIKLITYLLLFIGLYSLANTYALIMNKYKLVNFVILISLALLCFLFGHLTREIIIKITNILFDSSSQEKHLYLIIINIVLIIFTNIFNSIKYNKSIEY